MGLLMLGWKLQSRRLLFRKRVLTCRSALVTSIPQPIILEIGDRQGPALQKRQSQQQGVTAEFVGDDSTKTFDCQQATRYTLLNGSLYDDHGQVSAPIGVDSVGLLGHNFTTTISGLFGTRNSSLHWENSAFANETARFCASGNGKVLAILEGPLPPDCLAVDLFAVLGANIPIVLVWNIR